MAKRKWNNNQYKNNYNEGEEKGIMKSKIMVFFDWVWRLFALNTFTAITSLAIITILPSFVACFRTLKECYENDEQHIVRRYFENFVYCFKDTIGVGILFVVLFASLGYSFFYYFSMLDALRESGSGEEWITIFWLLFFISLFITMALTMVAIQLPIVVTYFRLRFFDKIRFSFYMAFKYFGRTLAEMLVLMVWGAFCFAIWHYVPIVFMFIFSIPLFAFYLLSRKYYWGIANRSGYEYQEDEFDITNKTQNRETYEDESSEKEKELEKINKL